MSDKATIFSKFEVTKKNGEKVKLRIQSLSEDKTEEVINFMLHKTFSSEETFFRTSGIHKSEDALKDMFTMYKLVLKSEDNCLVCCVDDENAEIAGCNLLIRDVNDNIIEEFVKNFTTPEVQVLFRLIGVLHDFYNPFDHFDIKVYLGGAGLSVDPAYRGCGIATELLKAREPLCKKFDLPLTGAWFTGIGSQKAAAKAGYEPLIEVPFDELSEKAGVVFTDVPKFCKLMALKINN